MAKLEGRILQRAEMYFQKKGETKARHVKNWGDLVKICAELKEGTGIDYLKYQNRVFVGKKHFPIIGKKIDDWPEKEAEIIIGPSRVMYNTSEGTDMRRVLAMGITDALPYGIEWMHNQGEDFLNSCLGEDGEPFIHVIYSLKSSIHDKIRAGEPWNRDSVDGLISRFNNNKVVRAWYILDEPDQGNPIISFQTQREIVRFIRDRSDKPICLALRGGTAEPKEKEGWKFVDLELPEWIFTNTYPFNGSGKLWGKPPLDGLDVVGKQQREYLKQFPNLKTMFLVQCCDEPAVENTPSYTNTQLPLGKVRDIWERIKPYGINTQGVGFWGFDDGYFGPQSSEEMYDEVTTLIADIK